MLIRQPTLDNTQAISALFQAKFERWQRIDENSQVEDLPYEQLSIYERWLHGGAWMSIETGAIWLSHLLGGAGQCFVLEDNEILGYAEAYLGNEPEPYNYHLHVEHIVAVSDSARHKLMQHLLEQAGGIGHITVATTAYDNEGMNFYQRYGLAEIMRVRQVNLSAQSGNVGFYKVTKHKNSDASQIEEWVMPIGRLQSARLHWEQLWSNLWHAIPEISARKTHRLRFNAAGQDAFVCIQQQLHNPRAADIYCWTPKALSGQLVAAIRDWSYKAGYRSLSLVVNEKIAKVLGTDLEETVYQQAILGREI
jgi:acetyltransferase (GNAT) family protein